MNTWKTIKIFRDLATFLACITLCVGCMSTRMGNDFNSDNLSKLKVGKTTELEVIQLIGQPKNRTRNSDGTVMLSYMYMPGQNIHMFSAFNPNLIQDAGAGMKQLFVTLDANGKVRSFTESGEQSFVPVSETNKTQDNSKVYNVDKTESQATVNKTEQAEEQSKVNKTEKKIDQPNTEQTLPVLVVKSKVTLRKSPKDKAATIKTLKKGEEVQVIKEKNDWSLVELSGGKTGWIPKSSLTQKD